jgi:predicted transcriptional regulator
MSTNFRPLTPNLATDKADEFHDEIQQAIQDLVRKGLVVDSGRRRWSARTGRYEIVWAAREFADRDQQKKLN